jgi:Mg2+-importing ATPase
MGASTEPSEPPFWSLAPDELFARLSASDAGLSDGDAAARLATFGRNTIKDEGKASLWKLLLKQFASPLVLILIFGAIVSLALHDTTDSIIILTIVAGSSLLSFWQEARASNAVAALRSRLALTSDVIREGKRRTIPAAEIVPGDILLLSAGNLVPADGLVLEATDFLVTQAALTGESLPVEKRPCIVTADAPVPQRANAVFAGSSVRSGTAQVVVVATGSGTQFGEIAERLKQREPETDFERGVRHFGTMLLRAMFLIVVFVLAVNQLLHRPFVDSMLFAVALAVGLSPELLPAIVTVTLSAGAQKLSKLGVIVRRLEAIENFGSMDVLCTDKTGTITTGEVSLAAALDPQGRNSDTVKRLGYLNALLESGIANPLDAALVAAGQPGPVVTDGIKKIDEIPYDFQRRRLTIVFEEGGERRLVTKGAFAEVLSVCKLIRAGAGAHRLDAAQRKRLDKIFRQQGTDGFRSLALATRDVERKRDYTRQDEQKLIFEGFLLFLDPPKETAAQALRDLSSARIRTKIITGDNRHVSAHVAKSVGLNAQAMITGEHLSAMSDEALWHAAPRTDLFVEIEPQQKERIVRALQRAGHAVGYLGDGINDAPALRAADIGISVDRAVDVARESADIVMLRPDLNVLCAGVEDGRRTFANTLKYINITISANFGNMISMALVTPLLPFLPLLPKQILLNNFLSDLPALAISGDRVDSEHLRGPQRWNVNDVERFMVVFGLASSVFDFATFGALLYLFHASAAEFRTGWFVVSLITELAVIYVLRTRRLAWKSRPSLLLQATIAAVFALALALPYSGPIARAFGLQPIDGAELAVLVAIVGAYLVASELLKHFFYRRVAASAARRRSSGRQGGG